MSSLVSRLLRDQDGVTAIEYALIASLISIAAVAMMTLIGTNVTKTFSTVASAFSQDCCAALVPLGRG